MARAAAARRTFIGLFAGFGLVALCNTAGIAVFVRTRAADVPLRFLHHVFQLGETLGMGLLAAGIVALWLRFVRLPLWVGLIAYVTASTGVVYEAIGPDLYRQACLTFDGRFVTPIWVGLVLMSGIAGPAAHVVGAWFSRFRHLWAMPVVVAIAACAASEAVAREDHAASHALVGVCAAILAGAALEHRAERWLRRTGHRARPIRQYTILFALLGILTAPSNRVRIELYKGPNTFAPWVLASTLWRVPAVPPSTPAPASPWFADRSTRAPTPPSTPRVVRKNPVVVFATIDATRGDVVSDPKYAARLPALTELRRTGVDFASATAPGSQTAVSLTTTFSGKLFSELVWGYHGHGNTRFHYAADDTTPRFPELLTARGVRTVSFGSVNFMASEFGVLRGFGEEHIVPKGRSHAMGRHVVDPVLDVLRRAGDEPLFLYFHLMEPHAPYDRATARGTDFERYVAEIALADGFLGRVAALLEQRFPDRGVLIVAADHGEAFGEHGTTGHSRTLYEELLHVPLVIRVPFGTPRRVTERVSLADVGPTVLDLFGVDTPPDFLGQSLAPLVAGKDVELDRPIFAEGRLRRAFVRPDGVKVIEDTRRKTVEAYDLERDPKELVNVFGTDARADEALLALRVFFAENAYVAPGYRPPFKP